MLRQVFASSALLTVTLLVPSAPSGTALALDLIEPGYGDVVATSPCSVTAFVPIRGSLSTPCRSLRFAYRIEDPLLVAGPVRSRFTGRAIKGDDMPDSVFQDLLVTLNQDSTIAMVEIVLNSPHTTWLSEHIASLEVHLALREYAVSLNFYQDTLFDGMTATLNDSSDSVLPLDVMDGWLSPPVLMFH